MTARIKFDDDKVVVILWNEDDEEVAIAVINGDDVKTATISLGGGLS